MIPPILRFVIVIPTKSQHLFTFLIIIGKLSKQFHFGIEITVSQKNLEGGWSGFGMATVGIHPNDFWVLNGHPNKIPTNEMLGDVV